MVAGALPFLRRAAEDEVGAGAGGCWGGSGDACATRGRLALGAGEAGSRAPWAWAGVVFFLRFRVLGTGAGVGGIDGGAGAEEKAAVAAAAAAAGVVSSAGVEDAAARPAAA
jgi:hypothetical protein